METHACLEASLFCFWGVVAIEINGGNRFIRFALRQTKVRTNEIGHLFGAKRHRHPSHSQIDRNDSPYPFYNAFLAQCREGSLSLLICNYTHGFPTLTLGHFCCECNYQTSCASLACRLRLKRDAIVGWHGDGDLTILHLQDATRLQLMRLHGPNGDCHHCKAQRSRCSRVLLLGPQHKNEFQREPSASALAIYIFNKPKYFIMLLRAHESARHTKRRLTWCFARDVPLCAEDRDFPGINFMQNWKSGWVATTKIQRI